MRLALLCALCAMTACSGQPADDAAQAPADVAPQAQYSVASPAPSPSPAVGRSYRYSSLTDCKLVREELDEMPYSESVCRGPAEWAVRIADSDARQTLAVIAPGGRESPLDLSQVNGGGFNSFGPTAEWRGPATEPFVPDSLIVRFHIAERAYPEPETAYLLAVRLLPTPCLAARIAPGSQQNAIAREAADRQRNCLQEG
jgi:hypothetical protein